MRKRDLFILAPVFVFMISFLIFAFMEPGQSSGWVQNAIAVISLPLIIWELYKIRISVNQKPGLEIGVISVQDLPLSKVRGYPVLPKVIKIGKGYPHFMFVIRNKGDILAEHLKIHIEYKSPNQKSLYNPCLRIQKEDKKATFYSENNIDFIFRAENGWGIHSSDFELFWFYFDTVVKDARPDIGETEIICSIWADKLAKPITENLKIILEDK